MSITSVLAVISALITGPVLAQESVPGTTVPSPGAASPDVTTGRLQKTDGGWRSSRIVGATVYNDTDQSIGKVDDLIVGQDGRISAAVISVGGFLGIGSKLVKVPYDQLRFEERKPSDTAANPPVGTELVPPPAGTGAPTTAPGATSRDMPAVTAPRAATPANVTITRIVLPGASKDSLTSMPKFDHGT
jgi:hypothetical protein